LHEEDGKCRQANVGHGVITVTRWPLPLIRKTGADLTQLPNQLLYGAHPTVESRIESRRKNKNTISRGTRSKTPQHVANWFFAV
jgi:hypothetical protein